MGQQIRVKYVAALEYAASINIFGPLAQQIESQVHGPPDENKMYAVQRDMPQMKSVSEEET